YHFTSRMVKRKHGDQVIKMRKWMRWPRAKSLKRMRTAIKLKTLRTNGTSIVKIVQSLNRTIRGWFGYFKHSHPSAIRAMDSYIRGRLRSILRKRRGGKGRGRGMDHFRWTNAYFDKLGLFHMSVAQEELSQSRQRAKH